MLYAKAGALFIFMVALELIALPAFALLLDPPCLGHSLPAVLLILFLADIAFAVIGTFVSAIAVHTRARDLIGPIIGLPLLLPALIATARGLGPLLTHGSSGSPPAKWLAVLALYDLINALLAIGLFDFLLEE
jgi:heme exporter protein B